MHRIAIYGPAAAALAVCTALVQAAGARPQPRAAQLFSDRPDQREHFDAVLVVDGPDAERIATHYTDREIPVCMVPPDFDPAAQGHALVSYLAEQLGGGLIIPPAPGEDPPAKPKGKPKVGKLEKVEKVEKATAPDTGGDAGDAAKAE